MSNLYKFRTEIYNIVVDFKHLSAIESPSRVATSSVNLPSDLVGVMILVTPGSPSTGKGLSITQKYVSFCKNCV